MVLRAKWRTKMWEEKAKYEPGLFLTRPRNSTVDLIENHPVKANVLTALSVAFIAILVFALFFSEVATIAIRIICIGTAAALYKIYRDSKMNSAIPVLVV